MESVLYNAFIEPNFSGEIAMSTAKTNVDRTDSVARSMFGLYVGALGLCLIGNLAVRMGAEAGWFSHGVQIAIAALTALPMAVAAVVFWRMLKRGLDEMLQRIVLEGLAFALIVFIPLAGLYVNLKTAGAWTPRLDPPDILFTPAILVVLGITLAWRRYR